MHWTSACLILLLIVLGFYMTNTEFNPSIYVFHKSFGVIAALLILARLIWRKFHKWQSSALGTKHEKGVSLMHKSLLGLIVIMVISGMMNSGFGGYSLFIFDFVIVPKNLDAAGNYVPYNASLKALGHGIHEYAAYLFSGLLTVHIGASLKHHFIDKDNTLRRMLGKN